MTDLRLWINRGQYVIYAGEERIVAVLLRAVPTRPGSYEVEYVVPEHSATVVLGEGLANTVITVRGRNFTGPPPAATFMVGETDPRKLFHMAGFEIEPVELVESAGRGRSGSGGGETVKSSNASHRALFMWHFNAAIPPLGEDGVCARVAALFEREKVVSLLKRQTGEHHFESIFQGLDRAMLMHVARVLHAHILAEDGREGVREGARRAGGRRGKGAGGRRRAPQPAKTARPLPPLPSG